MGGTFVFHDGVVVQGERVQRVIALHPLGDLGPYAPLASDLFADVVSGRFRAQCIRNFVRVQGCAHP